ncbi:MAG: hypothetical protein GY858_04320, partial [Candidatus Omnitrophica bacterium]|nr:hypothetical protein [Candidatus Omnitrophota bacterium]
MTTNGSGSNLDPDTLKTVLKRVCPPDSIVPIKGPHCARCDKNQYCSGTGAAVPNDHFQNDCSLQGNLHNTPCIATVSESVAGVDAPESLYLKSLELS